MLPGCSKKVIGITLAPSEWKTGLIRNRKWMDEWTFASPPCSHLKRRVAVVHGVFYQEVLKNADGQLSDLRALLQGLGHFSHQQTHQEVIPAVFLCQAELQTLLCVWAKQEVLALQCQMERATLQQA